ncbi:MAG TPA: glycosyltransferase [Anaerolineae bacterium]|nr:glycosyltransferase [Anaerolineae bacterium]HMR67392.1 glycosyltransferase [Anaerolineae bacterium]
MARLLFLTVGVTSYLNAGFQLARQLQRRGHEPIFASASRAAGSQVEAQGWPFIFLQAEAEALTQAYRRPRSAARLPQPVRKLPFVDRLWPYLDRSVQIAAMQPRRDYILSNSPIAKIIEQWQPDLLLIDYELHHHIIGTAKFGLPTYLLEYYCSVRQAPDVPPLYARFLPTGTPGSKLRAALSWQSVRLKRRLRYTLERVYYKRADWFSTLIDLARQENFPFEQEVEFLFQYQYLTYRHIPTLMLSAWEFDFPHEVENKTSYVGPMVQLERHEVDVDPRFWEVMAALSEQRRAGRALIYCSMGSLHSDAGYFQRVIAAVTGRPEWNLILAVGSKLPLEQFQPAPPNVHLFSRVPQLKVLEQADLMLAHGGIGTVNEALLLGVPLLVYSFGHMDQNGNAARVAYHGLGLTGDIRRDSPAQIAQKIERILLDPSFKTKVGHMRQIYQRYHQAEKAVRLIEERLPSKIAVTET